MLSYHADYYFKTSIKIGVVRFVYETLNNSQIADSLIAIGAIQHEKLHTLVVRRSNEIDYDQAESYLRGLTEEKSEIARELSEFDKEFQRICVEECIEKLNAQFLRIIYNAKNRVFG